MSEKDMQFGIDWSYAGRKLDTLTKRLICARSGKGNVPVWEQRKAVMQMIAPNHKWHRWVDWRLQAFCDSNWVTFIGPGGATKSTDAALFALEYWMEAPHETAVIICSTSVKMLKMRIWNELTKMYLGIPQRINLTDESGKVIEEINLGGQFGRLIATETKIMWAPGDDKHGLTGVAVEEGPVEQVVANHLGVHTKRVLLVIDEMQAVRPAILKAAASNMSKNESFKFLGFGNPDSKDSLLGRESEPVNGWSSIDIENDIRWKTLGIDRKTGGICVFTDGRKSPADDSPEERKRLPFLINKEQIDNHLYSLRGNADEPDFWTQSIGFFPPSGTTSTVLDSSIIEKWNCKGRAVWTKDPIKCAALDPAFSFGGGDKKVLQFFKFGQTDEEVDGVLTKRWVVEFGKTMYVPVKASSNRPLDYQILDFCKEQCEKEGVLPENFATDSTGIGRGLKSIFDVEWGRVYGCEFGGSPSDRLVNALSEKTAKEQYDYRQSELNMAVREFAMSNSIRGLPTEAAAQFCIRKTENRNKKHCVESKSELKKRINRSPDESDACAIALDFAKAKGAVASLSSPPIKSTGNQTNALRQSDAYYSEDSYLHNEYAA